MCITRRRQRTENSNDDVAHSSTKNEDVFAKYRSTRGRGYVQIFPLYSWRGRILLKTGVLEEVSIEGIGCQQKLILLSLCSNDGTIFQRFFEEHESLLKILHLC